MGKIIIVGQGKTKTVTRTAAKKEPQKKEPKKKDLERERKLAEKKALDEKKAAIVAEAERNRARKEDAARRILKVPAESFPNFDVPEDAIVCYLSAVYIKENLSSVMVLQDGDAVESFCWETPGKIHSLYRQGLERSMVEAVHRQKKKVFVLSPVVALCRKGTKKNEEETDRLVGMSKSLGIELVNVYPHHEEKGINCAEALRKKQEELDPSLSDTLNKHRKTVEHQLKRKREAMEAQLVKASNGKKESEGDV